MKQHRRSTTAALGGAVGISFAAVFVQLAGVSPVTAAFYRAAYAVPVLAVLWFASRKQDLRPASARWLGVLAGVFLAADLTSWHAAIEEIGVGLATLVVNSQVLIVALFGWLLFGERPRKAVLVALPIMMGGLALVTGLGRTDSFGDRPLLGVGLAVMAAFFYATFLLMYRASNKQKAPASGPLLEATIGAAFGALVFGSALSSLQFEPSWPSHGWLFALALGVQVMAWLLIGYALPRLPAVETSAIILLQPVLTLVWGALLFTERPSSVQLLGAGLVLVGVAAVAISPSVKTVPV